VAVPFNFASGVTRTRGVTCVVTEDQHWAEHFRVFDFGFDHTSQHSVHRQPHARQRGHSYNFDHFLEVFLIQSNRMQQESPSSFFPHLAQRFQSLVWSCLDSDLTKTAVFHAERYYALDQNNHDARHLYATALLREGQTYSALSLVTVSPDAQCSGCLEIKAKCSTVLGRHRQAREALEGALHDPTYIPSGRSHYSQDLRIPLTSGQLQLAAELRSLSPTRRLYAVGPATWH
jgi:hypothetical protein